MMSSDLIRKNNLRKLRQKAVKKLKEKNKISEADYELDVYKEELLMQSTELIETQEKLVKSLSEYQQLFDLAPLSYFVLNKNGIVMDLNQTALHLTGMVKSKVVGRPFSLLITDKVLQDEYYRYRKEVIDNEKFPQIESKITRSNGKVLSVLIESTILKNQKNEFKHFLSTVMDISERKEQEYKLEQALINERELNEIKSRFVSMASHEFRTPLTAIQTSVDIMGIHIKNNDAAKCEKHMQRIKSSIINLTEILNNFLALDMLENGEINVKKDEINIKSFTNKTIDEVKLTLKEGQFIEFKHFGELVVNIDTKIFQSILLNLLSNASKYSGKGKKIELTISVAKKTLKLVVKDAGIGIPAEEQGKIFSRLFRAKNAEMIGGTGLGLNILKKHIDVLNGKISFKSEENSGTSFEVEIPI